MPTKTRLLDYGGFVRSPDAPASPAFDEYLAQIDPLLTTWREAADRASRLVSAPEWIDRRNTAQRMLNDFAAAYRDQYTIKHVERNPDFLPVARFFARYRPVRRPFAILNCNLELPLHSVYIFENNDDLKDVNDALDRVTPLRWWQDGPMNHPCYLFGDCVWELKLTEVEASDKGLTLLFDRMGEQDKLQRDRLQNELAAARSSVDGFIPEIVRAAVWRRDGGKCARCGGHNDVDFCISTPPAPGHAPAPQNVQLFCARCRPK